MLPPNELLQGGVTVKRIAPLLKRVPGVGLLGSPGACRAKRGLGQAEGFLPGALLSHIRAVLAKLIGVADHPALWFGSSLLFVHCVSSK
jgi:hypothetical protein